MRRREFITLLGGAASWPLAARAQQLAMPVIGFLSSRSPGESAGVVAAFQDGLAEAGFIEGKNVAIDFRFAEGHLERLPTLAIGLVRRGVAVIFTGGGDAPAMVAKGATSTIPIVFVTGFDPVKSGLVTSLNRPDGNLTGATVIAGQLAAKRLGLLHELVPSVRLVAVLLNPNNPNAEADVADAQVAARALGQQIEVLPAGSEQELEVAFTSFSRLKADALLLEPDPLFTDLRHKIVALVERQRIPAIYYAREYTAAGGLLSYGASFTDLYRQGGVYVGRILKGTKAADLPVVQPTKFELIINLKTAKALGLNLPGGLLALADEVIE
jgi:putative ABC transport system substrate-binding protein